MEIKRFILLSLFKVNGAKTPLPHLSGSFNVYEEKTYIVFDDPRFIIHFDGKELLKIQVCDPVYYGLCRLHTGSEVNYPFTNYISEDSTCSV